MLETEHCRLRPLELSDLDQLYLYRNNIEIISRLGGFSHGYSRADLERWLEFHRGRSDEVLWAIADRNNDICIGHVGLYQIDYRVRKAEFAILIGALDYQSRGIGREVTTAIVQYGFREMNLHRIHLSVLASNERAIRLYQKLGFSEEGRIRDDQFRGGQYVDSLLMSILESEWISP